MSYYDVREATVVGFKHGVYKKDGNPFLAISIIRFADDDEIEKGQVGEIAEKHFVPANCLDAMVDVRKDDVISFKYYKDDNGVMRICKVYVVPTKK